MVVLAALVGSIAVSFEGKLREPAPNGGFEQEYYPTGADNTNDRPYVVITHEVGRTVDGDNIVIKDEGGNSVTWEEIWTAGPKVRSGERVHLDGFGSDGELRPICEAGQTYRIVFTNDAGETLVVNEWTAPSLPALPPSSPHDSDDDGIPDWC